MRCRGTFGAVIIPLCAEPAALVVTPLSLFDAVTMDDKSTEIRVAVALVALRFKPIRQSCIGYVLDLRDRFPCPGGDAQLAENTVVGKEWRERALELETRCVKLERMFQWDKLERLAETNTAGHGGGKRDKAENRTRAGLERVVNGSTSGQGECTRAHTRSI